jgi:hypothetical protein
MGISSLPVSLKIIVPARVGRDSFFAIDPLTIIITIIDFMKLLHILRRSQSRHTVELEEIWMDRMFGSNGKYET